MQVSRKLMNLSHILQRLLKILNKMILLGLNCAQLRRNIAALPMGPISCCDIEHLFLMEI